MIIKGSKLKLMKKTCALALGVVLAVSQAGLCVLAEPEEAYGDVSDEISLENEEESLSDENSENGNVDENIEDAGVEEQVSFEMTRYCQGVKVTMSAPEGVFPKGAYFEVREVSNDEEESIEDAVSEIRDDDEQVVASYTYDITLYDEDGNEIEPNTEYGRVSVTFLMDEATDSNLQAKIYHVEESGDELSAQELETSVLGDEVTALTDGFSYYVVEFKQTGQETYKYFMYLGQEAKLDTILRNCGILCGEISSAQITPDNGLSVERRDDGIWYVHAPETESFDEATIAVTIAYGGNSQNYSIEVALKSSTDGVTYLEGQSSGEYAVKICENPVKLGTQDDIANLSGQLAAGKFYYVEADATITCSGRLQVIGMPGNGDETGLILGKGATLNATLGINVPSGNALYIYAETEDNMGQLIARGQENDAGIGGANGEAAGTITIYSGIVEATGGANAAGIGGGLSGSAGNITINGGTVISVPQNNNSAGAGIGSGRSGSGGSITINGGTVTATGSGSSAGIGGGNADAGVDITINGGTINATGGEYGGAGIGGGAVTSGDTDSGKVGNITIGGGRITATGNGGGAGIGGGKNGNVTECTITINNGEIDAKGSSGAAGIGTGNGTTGVITIITNPEKYGDITPEDLAKGKLPKTPQKKVEPSSYEDAAGTVAETVTVAEAETAPKTVAEENTDYVPQVHIEPLLQSFQGKGSLGGICTFEKQGPLCAAVFKAATPAGYFEAFSFNLNLDATGKTKPNYGKKAGKFILNIPKQYRKKGRTFAIIGIGKPGKVKIFYDTDIDDETFTTDIDIEGYAFSLIYTDLAVKKTKNTTLN